MQSLLQFVIIGLGAGATYALFAQGPCSSTAVGPGELRPGRTRHAGRLRRLRRAQGRAQLQNAPACVAGIVAAIVVALLSQRVVLRALRKAAAIVRVIATVGLLGLLQALVAKRYTEANVPVEQFLPHDVWTWGEVRVQEERIYLVAISLAVTIGLCLRRSRLHLRVPVPRRRRGPHAALPRHPGPHRRDGGLSGEPIGLSPSRTPERPIEFSTRAATSLGPTRTHQRCEPDRDERAVNYSESARRGMHRGVAADGFR